MDLNRYYERYAEYFRMTFPFAVHQHFKNSLTVYQQLVQQELIVLLMNEATFAGNKPKSPKGKEEANVNHGQKTKCFLSQYIVKTYFKKLKR